MRGLKKNIVTILDLRRKNYAVENKSTWEADCWSCSKFTARYRPGFWRSEAETSCFIYSTKAHRCWPWPAQSGGVQIFLTCSNSEVRRIRWSCSYAQVWFRRWSPCRWHSTPTLMVAHEGGAFTYWRATTTLMKTRVFPLEYDVIGVLISVVKLCNL
jgi:hypothetical protein